MIFSRVVECKLTRADLEPGVLCPLGVPPKGLLLRSTLGGNSGGSDWRCGVSGMSPLPAPLVPAGASDACRRTGGGECASGERNEWGWWCGCDPG